MKILIGFLLVVLGSGGFSSRASSKAIDIIIDTDPAMGLVKKTKSGGTKPRDVDDGLAIVEAINNENLNVLAVTTVAGNCPTAEEGVKVANDLLAMKKSSIRAMAGANQKLTGKNIKNPKTLGKPTRALTEIRRILKKSDKPVTVVAIGPLTNIAHLVLLNSSLLAKVKRVVVVMGRSPNQIFEIGVGDKKVRGVRDFNFVKDPLATRIVLESKVPMVFLPFELSVQALITREHLRSVKEKRNNRVTKYIYDKSQQWLEYWDKGFKEGGFHPWDSAALAYLNTPEYLKCEKRGYRFRERPATERTEMEKKLDANRDSVEVSYFELGHGKGFTQGPYTYCHDFKEGKKDAFVKGIVDQMY